VKAELLKQGTGAGSKAATRAALRRRMKEYEAEWVEETIQGVIDSRGTEPWAHERPDPVFAQALRLIPERQRIIDAVDRGRQGRDDHPSPAAGGTLKVSVQSVVTRDPIRPHRPGGEPIDGWCLIDHCGKDVSWYVRGKLLIVRLC
jgi:hypothetical protein